MYRKISLYKRFSLAIFVASITTSAHAQMPNAQQSQPNGYPGFTPNNTSGNWPAQAQNSNETSNPVANTYNNPFASFMPTKFKSDFWTSAPTSPATSNGRILDAGTVLTGVLQEDISSKQSKAGDIFSITLSDNYSVNNQILIPQNSSFVGSVVSVAPAKKNRNGVPGNLEVSIQTLVSPDGVSIPVNAFIEYDPNQHQKVDIKKSRGVPVGEWAKSAEYSVYYAAGGLGSRFGIPLLYKGQTKSGAEFSLTKGELLPVKLSQALDVTPFAGHTGRAITQPNATPSVNNMPQSVPPIVQKDIAPTPIPTINDNTNMLPGNISPAGPEPF